MGALKTQEAHCWFNLQGKELLEEAPENQLLFFSVSAAAATSQHGGVLSPVAYLCWVLVACCPALTAAQRPGMHVRG